MGLGNGLGEKGEPLGICLQNIWDGFFLIHHFFPSSHHIPNMLPKFTKIHFFVLFSSFLFFLGNLIYWKVSLLIAWELE